MILFSIRFCVSTTVAVFLCVLFIVSLILFSLAGRRGVYVDLD